MLESDYPYHSAPKYAPSTGCRYSASKATNVKVYTVTGHPTFLKSAIIRQPLVTAIAANNKYIHSYASGIIDAVDCL